MSKSSPRFRPHPLRFAGRILSEFRRNQGFLLASAVAYNTLLSIVPLFAVLLVGLSHFIDEARLLGTVSRSSATTRSDSSAGRGRSRASRA